MAHYGTPFGFVFRRGGKPYFVGYAAIARAHGIEGVHITSAAEFGPALQEAVASGRPTVIDVATLDEPVPTAGYGNKHGHLLARPQGASRRAVEGAGRPLRGRTSTDPS